MRGLNKVGLLYKYSWYKLCIQQQKIDVHVLVDVMTYLKTIMDEKTVESHDVEQVIHFL